MKNVSQLHMHDILCRRDDVMYDYSLFLHGCEYGTILLLFVATTPKLEEMLARARASCKIANAALQAAYSIAEGGNLTNAEDADMQQAEYRCSTLLEEVNNIKFHIQRRKRLDKKYFAKVKLQILKHYAVKIS